MQSAVWKIILGLFCFSLLFGCNNNEAIEDGKIIYDVPRSDFTISLPDTWVVEEDNRPTGDPFMLHIRPKGDDSQSVGAFGHRLHENQSKQNFMDYWFEGSDVEIIESIDSNDLSGSIGISLPDDQGNMAFVGVLGTDRQIVIVSNYAQAEKQDETIQLLIEVMDAIRVEKENPRKAELAEQGRINGTNFTIGRIKNYTLRPLLEHSMKMEIRDGSAPQLYIYGHLFEREDVPGGWDVPLGERAAQEWLSENLSNDAVSSENIETENGLVGIVQYFEEPDGAGLIKRVSLIYKDQGVAVDLFGWPELEKENNDILFTAIESIEWDETFEE